MASKFTKPNLASATSVLATFEPWLKKWDNATMGAKVTSHELTLALQTQSGAKQKGTGTVICRALLFRKDGATKAQRDAVMSAMGRGPCENDGAFRTVRKAQWQDSNDIAPSTWRKVTLSGNAVVELQSLGRSHWQARLVKAAETTQPKADNGKPVKATGKAAQPVKGKAATATGKGKAKATGKAVKAAGKAKPGKTGNGKPETVTAAKAA